MQNHGHFLPIFIHLILILCPNITLSMAIVWTLLDIYSLQCCHAVYSNLINVQQQFYFSNVYNFLNIYFSVWVFNWHAFVFLSLK